MENEKMISKLQAENCVYNENIQSAKMLLMSFSEDEEVIEKKRTYKRRGK